jgi:hypothetical protein
MFSPDRSSLRLSGGRVAATAVLGTSLIFLCACQTIPPAKGMAQVSAAVRVEDTTSPGTSIGTEAVLYNKLQQQKFEAFGAGKRPDDTSGEFQAEAFARAEARRAALRELAKTIVAFGEDGESALKTILGETEGWEAIFEASLEKRAVVDYKRKDNLELARARIDGSRIFTGPGAPGSAGDRRHDAGESELEFLARRRKAEELALEAARTFLYEDLLPYGGTTNFWGVKRPPSEKFKEALRAELELVPPMEVKFTDEGECIVGMQYDRTAIEHLKR